MKPAHKASHLYIERRAKTREKWPLSLSVTFLAKSTFSHRS